MSEETSYGTALDTANTAILFLVLLIFGILLSLKSVLLQREGLCAILEGGDAACPGSPFPFQCGAGAITIGVLGYFFTLALRSWRDACREGDGRALCLARVNLWASLLVLAAAILRFCALQAARGTEEALSPDGDLPA